MVNVLISYCDFGRYESVLNRYQQLLPFAFIEKMYAFQFKEDSYRYLLGKILILKGASILGYGNLTLSDICFSEYNRPYFCNDLDFNVSHSGNYLICVLSRNCRVGVDLEKIKSVEIADFSRCFTSEELNYINSSDSPVREFYRFWTRKEAVSKADGRGLILPFSSFEVIDNYVVSNTDIWHIKELDCLEGYMINLATNVEIGDNYSVQSVIV